MALYLSPNGEHSSVGIGTCDGWGALGEEQFTNDIGLILNIFGCNFKSGSFTSGVYKNIKIIKLKVKNTHLQIIIKYY